MEQEQQTKLVPVAAIGISFSINLNSTQQIVFQTHIPQDATQGEIDTLLEKMQRAAGRQEAMERLETLTRDRAKDQGTYDVTAAALERYDTSRQAAFQQAGKRGEFKLTTAEQAQKENLTLNLEKHKEVLKRYDDGIAECKAKIDGSWWDRYKKPEPTAQT
jgi:hypothetical protein